MDLDERIVHGAVGLESPGLTPAFVVLSAWWVKAPLLVALALGHDLWLRRAPIAALAAGTAALVASLSASAIKAVVERPRPPQADRALEALVAVPGTSSFPSGHAATAFAAATAIAVLCPRLRVWVLLLAAAVAISRVYLRVHFPLDITAGALLGAAVGAAAGALALRRVAGAAAPQPA